MAFSIWRSPNDECSAIKSFQDKGIINIVIFLHKNIWLLILIHQNGTANKEKGHLNKNLGFKIPTFGYLTVLWFIYFWCQFYAGSVIKHFPCVEIFYCILNLIK